eukprot:11493666-Heterocapsa_arctica.AAC.1
MNPHKRKAKQGEKSRSIGRHNTNMSSHRGSRTEERFSPSCGAEAQRNRRDKVISYKAKREHGHESQAKDDLKAHTDRHQ